MAKAAKQPACPVLKIHTSKLIGRYEILATHGKKVIGSLSAKPYSRTIRNQFLRVEGIEVEPPYRRCGVGTRLYEAAAKLACERGEVLSSDVNRSVDSQGFWTKQVARGRARCVEPTEIRTREDSQYAFGRGGCMFYALKRCSITTLAGAPRKRRG
jgi:GNAT superfamily N-acetyltransferase